MSRVIKTTKSQIVNYWINNSLIDETKLNFDWSDASEVCWNCGCYTQRTLRCHIIPDMLEGEDVPSNYVLLCKECHEDAPDLNDKDAMWNWIKSNRTKMGLSFTYKFEKALEEFEKRNGFNFLNKAMEIENFNEIFDNELKNIGSHSGRIKISSYTYLFEKIIKSYIK